MERQSSPSLAEERGLSARPVLYEYRYCPRCRREWPANRESCPECVHWLGEQPLQRTEWQIAPPTMYPPEQGRCELVGACALILRLIHNQPSTEERMELANAIREALWAGGTSNGATCEVAGHGWLIWTTQGLRQTFRIACDIEQRLAASLSRLGSAGLYSANFRWGLWVDQYLLELLAALPTTAMMVVLSSRPSGRRQLRTLQPTLELKLNSLGTSAAEQLARRLIESDPIATTAALRSKGNPLLVEQFAAWAAETGFQGGEEGPHNLHQVIAARIGHLSDVRIADIRQRLRWGRSWEREVIKGELGQLESEIGLWLDRLETGDYADRVEAVRHLNRLEHADYELFMASILAGHPRTRSSRLREAIERLLVGSADQLLMDLKRRASTTSEAEQQDVLREAQHAGDVLSADFNWRLARDFYELAFSVAASRQRREIEDRLAECRRHSQRAILDDRNVYAACAERNLDEQPSANLLDLPYLWAELGRVRDCKEYFARAAEAAEAINDRALAAWARHKVAEFIPSNREVQTS
jgi:hypothetical protein